MYLNSHLRNTLLVDDTPYKFCLNPPFNAIFVESYENLPKEDNYFMKILFLYIELNLHYFGFNVPTFVKLYPFGTIKSFKEDDVRSRMLFKKCTMACYTSFNINCSTSIVGSPNSRAIVEVGLDEIPLISGGDSPVLCSPTVEVNPFHVIFDLNGVWITTCFNKGGYGKATSHTIIFHPRLKEFPNKCLVQFHVYIWFTTQHHKIYNYLDQIWHKTQISIRVFRVFN
jgi:hypothetical protein